MDLKFLISGTWILDFNIYNGILGINKQNFSCIPLCGGKKASLAKRGLEKSLRVQILLLLGKQSIFPQSKTSKLTFNLHQSVYFKIKQEINNKTLFIDI